MNKRIAKKLSKKCLTSEEITVLKLYRECESVQFYKYNLPVKDAIKFVKLLGKKPEFNEYDETTWFGLGTGKITATAFLK